MGRSPCCEKAHTNKGAWTKEEDDRLIAYIRAHGEGCWRSLPKAAGLLRCGKSCRLRWINYLRPDLKRGNFTDEEDELIIKLHSLLGNKWSLIAGRLPGRTDNEIKNYWNTHIRRKLLSRGIDPTTHRPINDTAPPPPSTINNTISFGATTTSTTHEEEEEEEKEEEEDGKKSTIINSSSPGSSGGNNINNNTREGIIKSTEVVGVLIRERCPDLNLELRISPPSNYQQSEPPLKTGGRSSGGGGGGGSSSLCFACSLGIQNSKDCACHDGTTSAINAAGYHDFLGLKGAGVLDYRSLEMK